MCCAAQEMLRIGQAAEMESDASTRHDELRFTLHGSGGQAVDPTSVVEPASFTSVVQAVMEDALGGQHPLAAMYVNDEQAILARIPVTDVAFLHGLRDKVLEGTIETLADVPGQSGGGESLTVGEDLEKPPAGGIAKGGIDGIRRNHLRWRRGQGGRRGWLAHGEILPA